MYVCTHSHPPTHPHSHSNPRNQVVSYFSFQMENSENSDFNGVHDRLSSTNLSSESFVVENGRERSAEDWGESTTINSNNFPDDKSIQQSCPKEIANLGTEIRNSIQEVVQHKKISKKRAPFPMTSFDQLERKDIQKTNGSPTAEVTSQGLSTEEIMTTAVERIINSSTETTLDRFISSEDAKRLNLVELLLMSAVKVANQQYDCASRLLEECDRLSSFNGDIVQRIVHCFSKALQEKINRETGKFTLYDLEKLQSFYIDEDIMAPTPIVLACHQEIPFTQIADLAGIQSIIENVGEAKKIHMLDLGIRLGVHCIGLMQALASKSECPLELLKITAIATTSKQLIENIGKRLEEFSKSIGLPFCFRVVMVLDILDHLEDLFEINDEETLVVYSGFSLRVLIPQPDRLESFMKVIKNLNPYMMVVMEPEYKMSLSSNFVNCLVGCLLHFSAYFDCLEFCMGENPNGIINGSSFFGKGINYIISTEEGERSAESSKLEAWREFFERFEMEEMQLSSSCLCQANMVANRFGGGNCCTVDMNGKGLLVGWKSTPTYSLSIWKFIAQKQ